VSIRGQSVVDEDDRLAADIGGGLGSSVQALAAGKLTALIGFDRVDGLSRDVEFTNRFLVQDTESAGCDCAHGQLFMAGDAELAHEKGIKGHVQCRGDLGGDGYAATR